MSELIDLNLKVKVVVVCLLSLSCFKVDLLLCFQMTIFLVGAVDLHRYKQIEWEKTTNNYKAIVVKAKKEKEAFESQFAILESEKTSLTKALEEAKVVRDEDIVMTDSLKFE